MKRLTIVLLSLALFAGCDGEKNKTRKPPAAKPQADEAPGESEVAPAAPAKPASPKPKATLAEARKNFHTRLTKKIKGGDAVEEPPEGVFRIVQYKSPTGKLAAYLTVRPKDSERHPAIIWITGGDCNSIGDVWSEASADNDQTAAAYRKAGIVMMFPSLRGGNQNPGVEEKFLGEVDDVLAAAEFLAGLPFVDPQRIYLGGHSTGGTLALLVAEASTRFRAVFAFGPVTDITGYGPDIVPLPFDEQDRQEVDLRAPVKWLHGIKTPTFVFEGDQQPSNVSELEALSEAAPASCAARFLVVSGATHFSVLAPANRLIAQKIGRDTGTKTNLSFTPDELAKLMR